MSPALLASIALARDITLLGAASALHQPEDEIGDAHQGWTAHDEEWRGIQELAAEEEGLIARLQTALALDPLSAWLVCFCLAAELHPEAAAALSILAEENTVHLLTPTSFARLAVAASLSDYTTALSSALQGGLPGKMGLLEVVEISPGRPLSGRGLRVHPSEITALLQEGAQLRASRQLHTVLNMPGDVLVHAPARVAGAHTLLAERGGIALRSRSRRAAHQLALDLATFREQPMLVVALTTPLPPVGALLRWPHALLVLDLTGLGAPPARWLADALRQLPDTVLLLSDRMDAGTLPCVEVEPLDFRHACAVWSQITSEAEPLARRFRLGLTEARAAVADAKDALELVGLSRETQPSTVAIAEQVLRRGARSMGPSVKVLRTAARLERLVVSPRLSEQLSDIVGWYEHTDKAHASLGIHSERGSSVGLTALFSGPSGTGKTFAARCLANTLGLNLYRIDLSQVVSKYIGETEKALSTVFNEAEAGHGLLLFDEADALFGKRSEARDAHDRYANVEVGYLLQRMESFDGVAILTTNLRSNLDPAFVRRIRFILEFPMPDATARRRLWEQSLPEPHFRTPALNLEPFVQRFQLSGGSISNIGLAATHLAAASEDGLLHTTHLVRATYQELEKSGMARSPSAFGPLREHLPAGVR
ncbi:MAG: AAA family ATPase [Myxococcota bacterium]